VAARPTKIRAIPNHIQASGVVPARWYRPTPGSGALCRAEKKYGRCMTTPTVTAATPNLNAAGCWYSIPVTFPLTGTSAAFVAIDRPLSLRYQAPRPRRPNLGPWRRDYRSGFQESSDTLPSPGGLRDGL